MSTTRTRLSTDARRSQLLALGLELFSKHSYDDVSVDEIAQQAGISKGLLYHYFGGKRAFYIACLREASRELIATTTPPPAPPNPSLALDLMGAYFDFVEARADAYITLLTGGVGTDPEVAQIIAETRQVYVDHITMHLGLVAPSGLLRLTVRTWVGAVEVASLEWLRQRDTPRDLLIETLLHMLTAALIVNDRQSTKSIFSDPQVRASLYLAMGLDPS
jgi:AcrR family transcriptional regulator